MEQKLTREQEAEINEHIDSLWRKYKRVRLLSPSQLASKYPDAISNYRAASLDEMACRHVVRRYIKARIETLHAMLDTFGANPSTPVENNDSARSA